MVIYNIINSINNKFQERLVKTLCFIMIKKRVEKLENLEKNENKESILIMLASEEVLKKDWENDLDERWNLLI